MSDKLPIGTVALYNRQMVTVVAHDAEMPDRCLIRHDNIHYGFEWTAYHRDIYKDRLPLSETGIHVEHVKSNELIPMDFNFLLHQYLIQNDFKHKDLLVKFVQDMT